MRKASIFVAGMATNAVLTPLAIVYVPPVRKAFALAVAAGMTVIFTSTAEAREVGRTHAEKFINILNDMDDRYNKEAGK